MVKPKIIIKMMDIMEDDMELPETEMVMFALEMNGNTEHCDHKIKILISILSCLSPTNLAKFTPLDEIH